MANGNSQLSTSRDGRQDQLPIVRRLPIAHPIHMPQLLHAVRLDARDLPQRGVMKDHIRRYAATAGDFEA